MSKNSLMPLSILDGEQFRKAWAEHGCDWAYFVLKFLQGRRQADIRVDEIAETLFYARCDDIEKRALLLVCAESSEPKQLLVSNTDELKERDIWLHTYLAGKNIGHADLVEQLNLIPAQVEERQHFDRTYFSRVYESPKLFAWLWERGQ